MNRTLIAFLFFVLMHTFSAAQNPFIRQFTTNDGLPTNTIYQIIQDHQGFIWMGSDAGLIKFDGSVFTNYRKSDGLSSNDIVRLKEDNQGRIWISSYNGALDYIKDGKIYNSRNTPFLMKLKFRTYVFDFFDDIDNSLIFYNYLGEIQGISGDSITKKTDIQTRFKAFYDNGVKMIKVYYIKKLNNNLLNLYCNLGIVTIDKTNYSIIDRIDTTSIFAVSTPTKGNLFIISRYGLFEDNNSKLKRLPFTDDSEKIKAALYDNANRLWIAAYGKGVSCLINGEFKLVLSIKDAHGLFIDKEQNIWVSTANNGLFQINTTILNFEHFSNGAFGDFEIWHLSAYGRRGVWLQTRNNIFHIKDKTISKLIFAEANWNFEFVYQFNEKLFFKIIENPLYSINIRDIDVNKKLVTYSQLVNYNIHPKKLQILPEYNKIAFFDLTSVGLIYLNECNPIVERTSLRKHINTFYINTLGEVVVSADSIFKYKDQKFYLYEKLHQFIGAQILNHLILSENTELISVDNDSLYLLNDGKIINLSNSLSIPVIKQVQKMEYSKNQLYLSTVKDVYIIHNPLKLVTDPNSVIEVTAIPLTFKSINDILIYNDSLYIASPEGLTILPEHAIENIRSIPPFPYIISARKEEEIISGNNIVIYGSNRLSLEFGVINYSGSGIIYSYSLEGSDTKWITYSGNQLNLIYQNLPPGKYKFKVKARKTNSDWSQPLEIAIKVKPTLLQNPFFRIFLLLLFGGAIALFFNFRRIRKMKKIQDELQLVMMEQKALQAMMNPHFIFNSLGSVQNYLLKNNNKDAVIYLSDLAKHIRQNLDALKTSFVLLDEEQNRLVNYLDLERKRLEGIFGYNIFIDDEFFDETIYIPGMMVQPFVENSIWHGIALVESGAQIDISFKKNGDNTLLVEIIDNGIGVEQGIVNSVKNARKSGLGISVTQKRLQLLGKKYNIETSLIISDAATGNINPGTRVQMVLPFFYSKKKIDE